jgi:hypothetical protein
MRRPVAIRWTADGECALCRGGGLLPVQVNGDGSRSALRKVCGCVHAEPAPGVSVRTTTGPAPVQIGKRCATCGITTRGVGEARLLGCSAAPAPSSRGRSGANE